MCWGTHSLVGGCSNIRGAPLARSRDSVPHRCTHPFRTQRWHSGARVWCTCSIIRVLVRSIRANSERTPPLVGSSAETRVALTNHAFLCQHSHNYTRAHAHNNTNRATGIQTQTHTHTSTQRYLPQSIPCDIIACNTCELTATFPFIVSAYNICIYIYIYICARHTHNTLVLTLAHSHTQTHVGLLHTHQPHRARPST